MINPAGSANSSASATAAADSSTCWSTRVGMPLGPVQFAPSANHWSVCLSRSTSALAPAGPGPRGERPLHAQQQDVGAERQEHREHGAHHGGGGEEGLEPV